MWNTFKGDTISVAILPADNYLLRQTDVSHYCMQGQISVEEMKMHKQDYSYVKEQKRKSSLQVHAVAFRNFWKEGKQKGCMRSHLGADPEGCQEKNFGYIISWEVIDEPPADGPNDAHCVGAQKRDGGPLRVLDQQGSQDSTSKCRQRPNLPSTSIIQSITKRNSL